MVVRGASVDLLVVLRAFILKQHAFMVLGHTVSHNEVWVSRIQCCPVPHHYGQSHAVRKRRRKRVKSAKAWQSRTNLEGSSSFVPKASKY